MLIVSSRSECDTFVFTKCEVKMNGQITCLHHVFHYSGCQMNLSLTRERENIV